MKSLRYKFYKILKWNSKIIQGEIEIVETDRFYTIWSVKKYRKIYIILLNTVYSFWIFSITAMQKFTFYILQFTLIWYLRNKITSLTIGRSVQKIVYSLTVGYDYYNNIFKTIYFYYNVLMLSLMYNTYNLPIIHI